ncbi:hypothetical protein DWX49_01485 [Blautia sp. AF19-34]|nr:hypothetical protein DWX49_01485 [Blautia sp. AF19-34]
MNAENLITDGEMWITTGESDLQDADRLGNICRVTSVALFLPFRKKIRASKKGGASAKKKLWGNAKEIMKRR